MYEPWTQNLYVYTGNNPVNFVDPTGHMASFLIAKTDGNEDARIPIADKLKRSANYLYPNNSMHIHRDFERGALYGYFLDQGFVLKIAYRQYSDMVA